MKLKPFQKQLGKVNLDFNISNDELVHSGLRQLLNKTDGPSNKSQIVHTKVLTPGDFQSLISQYRISDRMVSNADTSLIEDRHIYCDQLGSNLCWRCSRKIVDNRLKSEIHKTLPNPDPDILPRMICVENVLKNMNLPLFSDSEVDDWKNGKSDLDANNKLSNEPLFFPYFSNAGDSFRAESSEIKKYETNGMRHVTFNNTFIEEEQKQHNTRRRSIQFISPPVIMK